MEYRSHFPTQLYRRREKDLGLNFLYLVVIIQ